MIGTVALVLGSFAWLMVRAVRRADAAGSFQPEGKLRWTEDPARSSELS